MHRAKFMDFLLNCSNSQICPLTGYILAEGTSRFLWGNVKRSLKGQGVHWEVRRAAKRSERSRSCCFFTTVCWGSSDDVTKRWELFTFPPTDLQNDLQHDLHLRRCGNATVKGSPTFLNLRHWEIRRASSLLHWKNTCLSLRYVLILLLILISKPLIFHNDNVQFSRYCH